MSPTAQNQVKDKFISMYSLVFKMLLVKTNSTDIKCFTNDKEITEFATRVFHRYTDPFRTIHNIEHIIKIIESIHKFKKQYPIIEEWYPELVLAAMYHDYEYNPFTISPMNENYSAYICKHHLCTLTNCFAVSNIMKNVNIIHGLIDATQHPKISDMTYLQKIFYDLDIMSILYIDEFNPNFNQHAGVYIENIKQECLFYNKIPSLDIDSFNSVFLNQLNTIFPDDQNILQSDIFKKYDGYVSKFVKAIKFMLT